MTGGANHPEDAHDLAAWLRLQLTAGVGNASIRRLLAAFSLPQNIFAQDCAAWAQVLSEIQAAALAKKPPQFDAALQTLQNWLKQPGQRLLVLGDPEYPQALLRSPDAPLWLYVQCADWDWWRGWAVQERAPLLGVVGSRKPTPQGLRAARELSGALAEEGCTVVSGLALGVDAAAHEGALLAAASKTTGQGRTLAVVGTGLDVVYPRQHATLAQRILDAGGALISEYPLGTPPLAVNFPKRNRIIAGLGLGVLVVEAALQSGSLITARLAMEANREVFAIPGSIYAEQYQGCHALIKQGAQLVEGMDDIRHALPQAFLDDAKTIASQAGFSSKTREKTNKKEEKPPPSPLAQSKSAEPAPALVLAMGFEPISLDELLLRPLPDGLGDVAALQMDLLHLELEGWIARLAGGQYQRVR